MINLLFIQKILQLLEGKNFKTLWLKECFWECAGHISGEHTESQLFRAGKAPQMHKLQTATFDYPH